jgi:hypothetical protein
MLNGYWRALSGPKLLKLITAVSAMAIAYEGMSQGVMGAVNVAPEYGVCVILSIQRHISPNYFLASNGLCR